MGPSHWTTDHIPNLNGKTAVVTGANSGLGFQTSLELARKGAHVVLACRNLTRGQAAGRQILEKIPGASLEVLPLDLGDLQSVQSFVETFQQKYSHLHILINNAGVTGIPRTLTKNGFEMQFGVNHLGHFALTGRLFETILMTPGSRLVTVGSLAHRYGDIHFDDLMSEKHYSDWAAYAQSKLANLLFAFELQRRLSAAGSETISLAAHPGYSETRLLTGGPELSGVEWKKVLYRLGNFLLAQPPDRGALPELYASVDPQAQGGAYIGPSGWGEMFGYPKVVQAHPKARDRDLAERLWRVSEELTGVRFPL